MDIFSLVTRSISQLPDGPHIAGLRSVMKHITVAAKYLERGRDFDEGDLYTDVVYRTNQAFEGSLKEAYRVLAGAAPEKKTPDQIEKYLETNKLLSDRVVIQLTRYRQEWRNPSTHDYTLDFDESEAFLALVSVASFAKVLVDQIAISLAQKNTVKRPESTVHTNTSLIEYIEEGCVYLLNAVVENKSPPKSEVELLGLISGYFSEDDIEIKIAPSEEFQGHARPDLLLSRGDERVVVELKRSSKPLTLSPTDYDQIETYIEAAPGATGLLVMWHPNATGYEGCEWPPNLDHSDRLRVVLFDEIEAKNRDSLDK